MSKSRQQKTNNTSELLALTKHELDWLEREIEQQYAELDAMHTLTDQESRAVRRDLIKNCLRHLHNEREKHDKRRGTISELRTLAFST